MPLSFLCEQAWLPDGVHDRVRIQCTPNGTIASVESNVDGQMTVPGLTLPGFANNHSHAFHRALRGRTHADGGTFWTWRENMYALAARLDPESYFRLARLVFAELVTAGYTSVGEFHYLHHAPGGTPYRDPNAMSHALVAAAAEAGIRITLLDTCYLTGGIDTPLAGPQLRFGDPDVAAWQDRVAAFRPESATARVGAAVHSVRAVPRAAIPHVAAWATDRDAPLHVHLSEQPAENEACRAAYGRTPTELLHDAGALSDRTVPVHATHLTDTDIRRLGSARVTACFCPTTEADLADGIGPARELLDAGARLAIGSDQHAVVDPFLETRALEHGERLRTGQRGRLTPIQLHAIATHHAAIGQPGGRIEPGAPADLVTLRTDTVRTAGSLPSQLMLTASSSDVDTVIVGGEMVVAQGEHVALGPIGPALARQIGALWA